MTAPLTNLAAAISRVEGATAQIVVYDVGSRIAQATAAARARGRRVLTELTGAASQTGYQIPIDRALHRIQIAVRAKQCAPNNVARRVRQEARSSSAHHSRSRSSACSLRCSSFSSERRCRRRRVELKDFVTADKLKSR